MKPEEPISTSRLVMRRLVVVAVMMCILAAGIAARLLIQLPDYDVKETLVMTTAIYDDTTNMTLYDSNSTISF